MTHSDVEVIAKTLMVTEQKFNHKCSPHIHAWGPWEGGLWQVETIAKGLRCYLMTFLSFKV